jgi:hypothetical protein
MTWLSPSTSPLPPTAHRSRTFLLLTVIRLNPAQPCWRVTAPFGWRSCRDISASPADCGWPWR